MDPLGLKGSYKANVYTIWVHAPLGLPAAEKTYLVKELYIEIIIGKLIKK